MALSEEAVDEIDVMASMSGVSGSNVTDDGDMMDERLLRLYNESVEKGSLLPLLKEELKYRIQSRRLSEGKEELQVPAWEPEHSFPLTDEERIKIMERKDRNKTSAIRHRQRRKTYVEELQQRFWTAKMRNEELKNEIKKIREYLERKSKNLSPRQRKSKHPSATENSPTASAEFQVGGPSTPGDQRTAESSSSTVGAEFLDCGPSTSGKQRRTKETARNSVGSQTCTLPSELKRKVPNAVDELSTIPQVHRFVKVRVVPQYVVVSVPIQTVSLSFVPCLTAQERPKTLITNNTAQLQSVVTASDTRTVFSSGKSQSTLLYTTAESSKLAAVTSTTRQDLRKVVMIGKQGRQPSSAAATKSPLAATSTTSMLSSSSVQRMNPSGSVGPRVVASQLPTYTSPQQDSVTLEGVTIPDDARDAIIRVQLQAI